LNFRYCYYLEGKPQLTTYYTSKINDGNQRKYLENPSYQTQINKSVTSIIYLNRNIMHKFCLNTRKPAAELNLPS